MERGGERLNVVGPGPACEGRMGQVQERAAGAGGATAPCEKAEPLPKVFTAECGLGLRRDNAAMLEQGPGPAQSKPLAESRAGW